MSLEHCAGGEPLAADVAVVHARRRVDSPVRLQSCGDSVGYFSLSTGGCFSTSGNSIAQRYHWRFSLSCPRFKSESLRDKELNFN